MKYKLYFQYTFYKSWRISTKDCYTVHAFVGSCNQQSTINSFLRNTFCVYWTISIRNHRVSGHCPSTKIPDMDPVSQTFCFLVFRIPDEWQVQKSSVIHHHHNHLHSKQQWVFKHMRKLAKSFNNWTKILPSWIYRSTHVYFIKTDFYIQA
jgi:hypothetical protein